MATPLSVTLFPLPVSRILDQGRRVIGAGGKDHTLLFSYLMPRYVYYLYLCLYWSFCIPPLPSESLYLFSPRGRRGAVARIPYPTCRSLSLNKPGSCLRVSALPRDSSPRSTVAVPRLSSSALSGTPLPAETQGGFLAASRFPSRLHGARAVEGKGLALTGCVLRGSCGR